MAPPRVPTPLQCLIRLRCCPPYRAPPHTSAGRRPDLRSMFFAPQSLQSRQSASYARLCMRLLCDLEPKHDFSGPHERRLLERSGTNYRLESRVSGPAVVKVSTVSDKEDWKWWGALSKAQSPPSCWILYLLLLGTGLQVLQEGQTSHHHY